jgi:threonine/homoserine/homoserine lactone efflux protein
MAIVFNGIKFGIVLAFLVGPVFFTILQTSVERGFWKGALVAIGVSASDILLVVICYFGLIQFLQEPRFKLYMAYGGGGILIVFGVYYLLARTRTKPQPPVHITQPKGFFRYMIKGFLINGLSPSVIVFWIGTVSVTALNFGYSRGLHFVLFFGAVLVTVLSTDILKAYLAGRLGRIITPRVMKVMNIILGIGMIVFGVQLIVHVAAPGWPG